MMRLMDVEAFPRWREADVEEAQMLSMMDPRR